MKRIALIILAVVAIIAGSVSCTKNDATPESSMPSVSMSIVPDFSDGSVYSFSDNGSFFLKVTVTPKSYIEKLINDVSFICKADFRSAITKAAPESPDFTVVGKITSGSEEDGYLTASFTLTEDEMAKMREVGHTVSLLVEDADGSHGVSTPFTPVARYTRDGSGGDIVDFNGHKAVRLAGAYWATENIDDEALCENLREYGHCYFNDANAFAAAKSWGKEWMLPDKEQWQDLIDYCKWTYMKIDGERGYLVEGKSQYDEEGNSIFIPCVGYFNAQKKPEENGRGFYWTSSSSFVRMEDSGVRVERPKSRYSEGYLSVRPVHGKTEVVFGVSINSSYIVLELGASSTLTASIRPSAVMDATITWSSSNPDVASVDAQGNVTAVSVGEATIEATTNVGGFTATCDVTVNPNAVDLGLSVKWASMNLKATDYEKSGNYYAWGATSPNPGSEYSWAKCPYCVDGIGEKFSKYVTMGKMSYWGGSGSPDDKRELESGDDAASAKLGGKWRTPTSAEFEELVKSCDIEWTTVNNVNGLKFTSKINGNSIFLPAAGSRNGNSLNEEGVEGLYMTSSLATDIPDHAESFRVSSSGASKIAIKRNIGRTIRPVTE